MALYVGLIEKNIFPTVPHGARKKMPTTSPDRNPSPTDRAYHKIVNGNMFIRLEGVDVITGCVGSLSNAVGLKVVTTKVMSSPNESVAW